MIEKTLAIIKPDAVEAGHIDNIVQMIKDHGFSIVARKNVHWSKDQAEQFYAIHKERPFFGDLVEYMTSGPIEVMVLEKDNAVIAWRDLMGATDPSKAEKGTVRALFGTDIGRNATHGSDSVENATIEIKQFFSDL